jgi:Transcriptional regulator
LDQGTDREEKRKKIMLAALKAYEMYGIPDATTRQIAEIAGIGKSTIYEYFKNSEELVCDAFSYFISEMGRGREEIRKIAESDPEGALSLYFDITTELVINEPNKVLLISQYIMDIFGRHRDFKGVKKEYGEKFYPSVKSLLNDYEFIIKKGMEKGVIKPIISGGQDKLALVLMALVREMQTQIFIQDESQIRSTCQTLKEAAFGVLGIKRFK